MPVQQIGLICSVCFPTEATPASPTITSSIPAPRPSPFLYPQWPIQGVARGLQQSSSLFFWFVDNPVCIYGTIFWESVCLHIYIAVFE